MVSMPRFLLLHGSVTGKAESIAELIAEEADRRGLHADVHCMSQVEKQVLEDHVNGFIDSSCS